MKKMQNRSWSQAGRGRATGCAYDHFLGQLHMQREKMAEARNGLQRVHPVFKTGRDVWSTHCDFAISSLARFKKPVIALRTQLKNLHEFPVALSEHYYPLMLSLCQVTEQEERLQGLISSYRHVCQEYSPQKIYQKRQISDALEKLLECCDEALCRIEHLVNETRFLEKKHLNSYSADL
jgi:hypothetical protein